MEVDEEGNSHISHYSRNFIFQNKFVFIMLEFC